jgi:hypothetical protein
MITRHPQGFTVVHPMPAFPSPVTPDGTGILGLSPELHTRLSRTQQRMSGRGRAWTLPGLRPWHQPASFDALTHHVRPHVAAITHHVAGARHHSSAHRDKAGRPARREAAERGPNPPAQTGVHSHDLSPCRPHPPVGCRAPGRGTRRARVRGRPSGVKTAAHRYATAPQGPALSAGASTAPQAGNTGRRQPAPPRARRVR